MELHIYEHSSNLLEEIRHQVQSLRCVSMKKKVIKDDLVQFWGSAVSWQKRKQNGTIITPELGLKLQM